MIVEEIIVKFLNLWFASLTKIESAKKISFIYFHCS